MSSWSCSKCVFIVALCSDMSILFDGDLIKTSIRNCSLFGYVLHKYLLGVSEDTHTLVVSLCSYMIFLVQRRVVQNTCSYSCYLFGLKFFIC